MTVAALRSPRSYAPRGASLEAKLLDKLVVGDGCWYLLGAAGDRVGYTQIKHQGRKQMGHRAAYEVFVGPVPAGMELDHLCRNRRCVRPDHLEPVTHEENVRRAWRSC